MSRKKNRIQDEQIFKDKFDFNSDEEMRFESKYSAYNKKKDDEVVVKNAKGTFRRYMLLLKPYWFPVMIVLLASLGYTVVDVVTPDYMSEIINMLQAAIESFVNTGNSIQFGGFTESGSIMNKFLQLGGLYLATALLNFIQQFVGAGVSQKLVYNLRRQANDKLSRLPLRYFDKFTKGEIISKVVNDIDNISGSLQSTFITVITGVLQIFGALYMMLRTKNWIMTLAAIILVPFSGVISYKISRISKRWFRRYWATMGALNGHVEEMYTGHNIVRIFNHEQQSIDEFKEINFHLKHNSFIANMLSGILSPILTLISNINYVGLCVLGGCYYIGRWFNTSKTISSSHQMGLGSIQAFLSYSSMFSSPITSISSLLNKIQSALASAERVFELLDEQEQSYDDTTYDEQAEDLKGLVEFKNVSFSYNPDTKLIEDFNLVAKPGQTVAIVGPTGAGKTTIVNLLMRFYDIDKGEISIDGIDTSKMSRNRLRDNFGMVLQDTWLFKGTIRENIKYGNFDATDEQMYEAAKNANIHEYIMTLPKQYDTMLTEDATNISQGQRQLITIARAILKDPKILILDEATSSVDTRTEALIQEAMDVLMAGRTCFVIAHRLSTIKNADNIVVMKRGSIIEQGTHRELMDKDGFYATLYNSQFSDGVPEDVE